jgi:hypothetical protein
MSTRMSHRRFSTCVQGLYSVNYSRAYAPRMEYILISSLPSLHALLQSFRDPITPSRSTCGFPKLFSRYSVAEYQERLALQLPPCPNFKS